VLKETHPATSILANSGLQIRKEWSIPLLTQLQLGDRFVILDPHGNHAGYIAEKAEHWLVRHFRQYIPKRRELTIHVFNKQGNEVLRVGQC
jgi:hypothetical protein